jgi:hypothetical protein
MDKAQRPRILQAGVMSRTGISGVYIPLDWTRLVSLSYFTRLVSLSYFTRLVSLSYFTRLVSLSYFTRLASLSYFTRLASLSYFTYCRREVHRPHQGWGRLVVETAATQNLAMMMARTEMWS